MKQTEQQLFDEMVIAHQVCEKLKTELRLLPTGSYFMVKLNDEETELQIKLSETNLNDNKKKLKKDELIKTEAILKDYKEIK